MSRHGKATGKFKNRPRRVSFRKRYAITKARGKQRFYNKPPPNGDYRSRIIAQLKANAAASADFSNIYDHHEDTRSQYGQNSPGPGSGPDRRRWDYGGFY